MGSESNHAGLLMRFIMPCSPDPVLASFSPSYSVGRQKFRDLCARLNLELTTFTHPLTGPDDVELAVDAVRLGAPEAENLVVVISGTHGLEGLAGSGCQVAWLQEYGARDLPKNTAFLFVHMINPWGAAWGRRQTEDNVDLNRNFMDFTKPLPENPHYEIFREVARGALGGQPESGRVRALLGDYDRTHGENAIVGAIFQGQYCDPLGAGFGGTEPAWSNRTFRDILHAQTAHTRHVAVIDIHTGLGPYGYGMLINASHGDSLSLKVARDWYGANLTAIRADPAGIPYDFAGDLCSAVEEMLPAQTVVPVALEFGTFSTTDLVQLQIEDAWIQNCDNPEPGTATDIRFRLQEFFHPGTDDWCEMLYFRARQVIGLATRGLASLL